MDEISWLGGFAGQGPGRLTPQQLTRVFEMLDYDFAYEQQQVAALNYLAEITRRWGNLSTDVIEAIVRSSIPLPGEHVAERKATLLEPQTPEEEDIRFALAALAVLCRPETSSVLLPYLLSPHPQERWLAALALAAIRDERAFSAIERMLIEFVGPDPHPPGQPSTGVGNIFQNWRYGLLRLLGDWGHPYLVPFVRAGLIATARAEELEVPEPHGPEQEFVWAGHRYTGQEAWRTFYNEQLFWVDDEHQFVYALGRLAAFGALEGVPMRSGVYSWQDAWTNDGTDYDHLERRVPESRRNGFRSSVWRVHLCFGALESRFRGQGETIYGFSDTPELATAVEELLAGKFGMDEAERHQAMADYDQADWVYWTPIKYGWRSEFGL